MFDTREALRSVLELVQTAPPATDDAERVDAIRLLEQIKSAAAAVQAEVTAAFVTSQRAAQGAAGVPRDRVGRGIAAQVGLARRISPFHAQRYVGWACVLTGELPATFAALRAGRIPEWRALLVARETLWLSRADRALVDAELAPRLPGWGDRRVEAETRRRAYQLDPAGFMARIRGAHTDRRVSLRPAPDTMCRLTGLLPVGPGVAAYTALTRHADTLIGGGDPRSRGQIMADTLIERLTGQASAGDVPVEINLILTDTTLLAGPAADRDSDAADLNDGDPDGESTSDPAQEPAQLLGYGPLPAGLARQLIFAPSPGTPRWLRRLYRHPDTGQLAAMDSTRRRFTTAQRHFLQLRDQTCRTPWCDAPIRHLDHVIPHANGGPTSIRNAQGTCQACNHAKQAPGWHARPTDRPGEHTLTTPTGHTYRHAPPDPPGATPSPPSAARADPPAA